MFIDNAQEEFYLNPNPCIIFILRIAVEDLCYFQWNQTNFTSSLYVISDIVEIYFK